MTCPACELRAVRPLTGHFMAGCAECDRIEREYAQEIVAYRAADLGREGRLKVYAAVAAEYGEPAARKVSARACEIIRARLEREGVAA